MVHRKYFQVVLTKNDAFRIPFCGAQASHAFSLLCLLAMSSRLHSGSTLYGGEQVMAHQQVKEEHETQEMQTELEDTLFIFGKFWQVFFAWNTQNKQPLNNICSRSFAPNKFDLPPTETFQFCYLTLS